jgi:branched-chain amino acid transport system permease protein
MISRRQPIIFWTGFAVVVALLIVAPLVLPEFWRRFLTEILIWGLLAMSSDILIGYTGMVSFGHSAFFGLGMYGAAAALLTVSPPNLWLAFFYGLVGAAAVAAFVAYFSTRLRDIYFTITTLIFSQIFYVVIFTWTEVTGGENGLGFSRPALAIPGLFSLRFTSDTLHWFVLAVVTVSYLLLRRITQSPFGMVLQSIRENEARTRAIGYPIERYKIVAVMLSGLFAGLAGVLYALQNRFAAPDFVFFVVSGEVVIYNVIGGIGTLVGPIVGAAFFLLLREAFSRFFTEYYLIPLGVIFIAIVIFMPQGLLGFLRRRLNE